MTHFIKLRRWNSARNPAIQECQQNGAPVWVNANMICDLTQVAGIVCAVDGPQRIEDRPREIYTCISFPAASAEEQAGICVLETPEEIIALIDAA
jgi:hypothetical protein